MPTSEENAFRAEALKVLREVMLDPELDGKERAAAAKAILQYTDGGETGEQLSKQITNDELFQQLRAFIERSKR